MAVSHPGPAAGRTSMHFCNRVHGRATHASRQQHTFGGPTLAGVGLPLVHHLLQGGQRDVLVAWLVAQALGWEGEGAAALRDDALGPREETILAHRGPKGTMWSGETEVEGVWFDGVLEARYFSAK